VKPSLRDLSSQEMERSGCSDMLDKKSTIDKKNLKFASMCYRHYVQILSLVVVCPDSFCID
jgi:hypothetical protein